MFCHNCGYNVEDGSQFCPSCGAALGEATSGVEVTFTQPVVEGANPAAKSAKSKAFIFSLIGFILALVANFALAIVACNFLMEMLNFSMNLPTDMSQSQALEVLDALGAMCGSYGSTFLIMALVHLIPLALSIVGIVMAGKEKQAGINSTKAKVFGIIALVLSAINFVTLIICAPVCMNIVEFAYFIAA